jgi:hypothetical protein
MVRSKMRHTFEIQDEPYPPKLGNRIPVWFKIYKASSIWRIKIYWLRGFPTHYSGAPLRMWRDLFKKL